MCVEGPFSQIQLWFDVVAVNLYIQSHRMHLKVVRLPHLDYLTHLH